MASERDRRLKAEGWDGMTNTVLSGPTEVDLDLGRKLLAEADAIDRELTVARLELPPLLLQPTRLRVQAVLALAVGGFVRRWWGPRVEIKVEWT